MESSQAGDRSSTSPLAQPTGGPRSILVQVDAGAHALARLQAADSLARFAGARLSALHGVQRLPPGTLPAIDNDDEERHRLALLRFERFAAERKAQIEWLSSSGDRSIERFVRVARLADLLVLGQQDPADAQASDVPAGLVPRIVIESGTPALDGTSFRVLNEATLPVLLAH